MSANNVFVYGTLLFPEVTSLLRIYSTDPSTGKDVPLIQRDATLLGYRRHTVRLREVGNFPAIVQADDSVEGSILLSVSDSSLRRLDEFEGIADGNYLREEVVVDVGQNTMAADAYICGEPLIPHLDGVWDPAAFRAKELNWYLENVVR